MAEQENQQHNAEEAFELPADGRMVLRTENLVKKYGKRTVVSHVSINVNRERLSDCWVRTELERQRPFI